MHRPFSISLGYLSVGLFLATAGSIHSQASLPAPQTQIGPAMEVLPAGNSNLPANDGAMRLNVVVTDKGGKNIPSLAESDFQLFDNNRPVQITSFRAFGTGTASAQPPARVIIVFDTVNMPFESVSYTREQVAAYLRQNGGHLPYPVSLAFLTNTGMQIQSGATTDGNALAKSLESTAGNLRTIGQSAGAWGAIERFQFCVKMLATLANSIADEAGRKLVIWAGPGWPLLDSPGIDFSLNGEKQFFSSIVLLNTMLREGQIELSSVAQGTPGEFTYVYQSYLKGVKKPTQAMPSNLALKVIATQSGGRVIPPSNDVATAIASVVQDAGVYYEITFNPPPPDGPNEYHELKLKLNQPGLTAHTNTGYYGQPRPVAAP